MLTCGGLPAVRHVVCKPEKVLSLLLSKVPFFASCGVSCRELSETLLQSDVFSCLYCSTSRNRWGPMLVLLTSAVMGLFL